MKNLAIALTLVLSPLAAQADANTVNGYVGFAKMSFEWCVQSTSSAAAEEAFRTGKRLKTLAWNAYVKTKSDNKFIHKFDKNVLALEAAKCQQHIGTLKIAELES